jgi:hypothetical protein
VLLIAATPIKGLLVVTPTDSKETAVPFVTVVPLIVETTANGKFEEL